MKCLYKFTIRVARSNPILYYTRMCVCITDTTSCHEYSTISLVTRTYTQQQELYTIFKINLDSKCNGNGDFDMAKRYIHIRSICTVFGFSL